MISGFIPDYILSFLITLSAGLVLALFPLAAVLYGWYTHKGIIAAVIGVLLFPVFVIAGVALQGPAISGTNWIAAAAAYYLILAVIGGSAGYLASREKKWELAAAFILVPVWIIVMFSGIS